MLQIAPAREKNYWFANYHNAIEEIEERHGEIPRDRDVVLYCS